MEENYLPVVQLGLSLIQALLGQLKSKVPAEIVASLQASADALEQHQNDLVTKANLEAQRG
jgi:hypothetical protein